MDDDNKWFVLEGMKATVKPPETVKDDQPVAGTVQNDNWYSLEGEFATQQSDDSNVQASSSGNVPLISNSITNSFISMASQATMFDTNQLDTNLLIASITDKNSTENDKHGLGVDNEKSSETSLSGLRLNLQESIDGEISESHHSSSINSTHSVLSSNLPSANEANNTSSLLQRAQNANWSSFLSNQNSTREKDSQWINLQNSNNIQDISRPEPLGFARNDTGLNNFTTSISSSITSPLSSSVMPASANITKETASLNISENSLNYSNGNAKELYRNVGKLDNLQKNLTSELSSSENDIVKQTSPSHDVNSHQVVSHDINSEEVNFSSLSSSLTMPSYKEVSPKSRNQHETPVTKLLGSTYKQTQQFLKDLKNVKLTYESDNVNMSTLDDGISFTMTGTPSRSESCQMGESQLRYADLPAHNEDVSESLGNKNALIEQDITSASIDGLNFNKLPINFKQQNKDSSQLISELDSSVSKSSYGKRDSEGELSLSELTDPLRDISNLSSTSQTAKSKTSSSSTVRQNNLEPIQEVLSPDYKRQSPRLHNESHLTKNNRDQFVHRPPTGDVQPSSKPSRGIYDIRNSTSPGSSNRKRILSGKPFKCKPNSSTSDPLLVYVSEDSKLTESALSNSSQYQPYVEAEPNVLSSGTSRNMLNLTSSEDNSLKYVADSRIKEIADRVLYDYKSNTDVCETSRPSHETSQPLHVTSRSLHGTSQPLHKISQPLGETLHPLHGTSQPLPDSHKNLLAQSKSTDDPSSTPTEYTDGLLASDSTFFADSSSNAVTPVDNNWSNTKREKKSLSIRPTSTVKPSNSQDRAISSHSSKIRVPSVYENRSGFPTANQRTPSEENNKTGKSLNRLWEDFNSTFKRGSDEESPVIKKLELFSQILSEQKKNRSTRISKSITSDSSSSVTSTPFEIPHNRKQPRRRIPPTENVKRISNGKRPSACPYCQKREVGTNCPTPCTSDVEADRPLMLQTWTQTTPSFSLSGHYKQKSQTYEINTSKSASRNMLHKPKRSTWFKVDKENNQNIENTGGKISGKLQRKDTYIIRSPDKSSAVRSMLSDSAQRTFIGQSDTGESDATYKQSKKKHKQGEVNYTAWFQSMRSDVSDILPLSEVPKLYIKSTSDVKQRDAILSNGTENTLSLQDAFKVYKQNFIHRSKQRVQNVKDARLDIKHGRKMRVSRDVYNERGVNRQKSQQQKRSNIKRSDSAWRRKIMMEKRPTFFQRQEEEHHAMLRKNRLKMKQYDLNNRQLFLHHRPTKRSGVYFAERH
ncbi:uncharacterized protein LOC130645766 [Hydractinia symbiolongicarpus]|uniref:uncharacterized protein LOC130645766 n=1 Tax=Hydractinia symbiolongicarpus TaxID=13093 RepID=UPI00254FC306|nr:uncharacterized protein LOC130645766 [Hydractinia symbiolongicarpus]